ncbi:MAG: tandem-95 repeat protein [Ardenticatenaceae bacterium]|nr:tandem-95 repeat protein [Ardenticatenaceae bacterium]MCB9445853.1 tandem-95 repeat protein [Ardenticatenaceae bacterium]
MKHSPYSVLRPFILTFVLPGMVLALLAMSVNASWMQTTLVSDESIIVNSSADNTTAGDGICTLREAIANANSASDTTDGDCVVDSVITFDPALDGQTITLNGSELSLTGHMTINGPGAQLLTISGGDVSRVFNVGSSGVVEIRGVTIANGRVTSSNGGGINNAGTLVLSYSTVAQNAIASGGVTNGGGIHNSGVMTITHSAIISNTNAGTTARGGGVAGTAGRLAILNSTISGNNSNIWGGGVHNTGSSTLLIDHSTIARNTAVTFWGGGLLVENNTAVTIKNSILAENEDNSGPRECYYFGTAPTSQGYNVVENRGNCPFNAAGDVTAQDAHLGTFGNSGGPATDYTGQPTDPNGQATWTIALLSNSPAIDRIPNGVNGCTLTHFTDQRGYVRADACDSGAFEYDGIQLTVDVAVDDDNPGPSQIITYTVVAAIADSGPIDVTGIIVTDSLPAYINYIGPVTAVGSTTPNDPPTLVNGLTLAQGTAVTFTFPVSVSIGLKGGTEIVNPVAANSAETAVPAANSQTLIVRNVPPVAVADTPTVDEDSGTTNFTVQANDYDLNWDSLTISAVGGTNNGGTAVTDNNSIDYTPTLNFNGTEVFTYTLSDGLLSHTTSVTVTVTPVNDAPVIDDSSTISLTVAEDSLLPPFHLTASDVDGDVLTWRVADAAGTAVISSTNALTSSAAITYTLGADFVGLDSFEIQAGDGALTDTVTVNITVTPLSDPPQAADDFVIVVPADSGTPIVIDVLTNDVEVDGETLLLENVGQPNLGGAAQISGTLVVYTPTLTLGQTETFAYTVSDGHLVDTAVIRVKMLNGLGSGRRGETMTVGSIGSSQAMTVSIDIPTNVIGTTENFGLVVGETAVSPQPLDEYHPAGLNLTLDAYLDGVLTSPFTMTAPVTLTITYSEDGLSHLIRGERDLALYFWSGSEWDSDGITLVEHDMDNNRIVFALNHLTDFALFGWDGFPVYLPIILGGS